MSHQRIKELLAESVEGVPVPHFEVAVVARARRVRRQRAIGGVAALSAVVVIATLAVGPGSAPTTAGDPATSAESSPSQTQRPTTGQTPTPRSVPEGATRWRGYDVWLGPRLEDEPGLPRLDSVLPASIDPDLPSADSRVSSAIIAVGLKSEPRRYIGSGGILLIDATGNRQLLPLPDADLDLYTRTEGRIAPFGYDGLSPDGTRVVVGEDDAVWVYDLPTQEWTRHRFSAGTGSLIYGPGWATNDVVSLGDYVSLDLATGQTGQDVLPGPTYASAGRFYPNGPVRTNGSWTAQSAYSRRSMTALDVGITTPDVIVAEQLAGEGRAILVLPVSGSQGANLRSIECCHVAGWLDEETVLFESDSFETLRLLAWNVTSGDVQLVSSLPASWEFQVAYADLHDFGPGG